MKAYTFTLAPVIESDLEAMGYDCPKLQQAVESDGNANLKVDPSRSSQKTANRFTPERTGVRTGKPAASSATSVLRTYFTGDGSLPREFAAWHDAMVKLIAIHGPLAGSVVLPTRLKAWLDHTFRKGSAVELSAPKGNRRERRKAKRAVTVAVPAAAVPGNGNGTPVASE